MEFGNEENASAFPRFIGKRQPVSPRRVLQQHGGFSLEPDVFRLGQNPLLLLPGTLFGKMVLEKGDQLFVSFALARGHDGGEDAQAENQAEANRKEDHRAMRSVRIVDEPDDRGQRTAESGSRPGQATVPIAAPETDALVGGLG